MSDDRIVCTGSVLAQLRSCAGSALTGGALVGRDEECARLVRMLAAGPCLVTLVGPGGSGKTTLARHVARHVPRRVAPADEPPEVCWVELADLRDPALVAGALLAVLGAGAAAGADVQDAVRAAAGSRSLLVVLDNCEHVLDAVRPVVAVLRTCPGVRVLATSRQALGVDSEVRQPVNPLPLPAAGTELRAADLLAVPSVRLFVDRAVVADPGFALTAATAGSVARICAYAQGLPLALELLAVRLATMPVEELLARLDSGGDDEVDSPDTAATADPSSDAGAPADRLSSMRASSDWAYRLLAHPEQLLLRRLSVFEGGWTRSLAHAVCVDADLDTAAFERAHDLLVECSLVQEHDLDPRRWSLLAPVRGYAHGRLTASGEADRIGRRFVAQCLALVEREVPHRAWTAPPDIGSLVRLDAERANLLAAVDRADRGGDHGTALQLTVLLWEQWRVRGLITVGRLYTERLVGHVEEVQDRTGTDALLAAGAFAQSAGDLERAERHVGAALARSRRLGDEMGYGAALSLLANVAVGRGDLDRAVTLYEQTLVLARAHGNTYGEGLVLVNLALAMAERGDAASAREALDAADALLEATGDVWFRAYALTCLARVARQDGDRRHEHRSLLRSAELLVTHGGGPELAETLEHLAGIEGDSGNPVLAVRLHASAHGERERSGSVMPPGQRRLLGARLDGLKDILGGGSFATQWAHGRATSPAAAVAAARLAADHRPRATRQGDRSAWPLTARELEVAQAVARGLTNKDIAAHLHISAGTVKTHLGHCLAKLGFGGRAELAAWAARRETSGPPGPPPRQRPGDRPAGSTDDGEHVLDVPAARAGGGGHGRAVAEPKHQLGRARDAEEPGQLAP